MEISSMTRLNSREIKKILFGVLLSDGSIYNKRFDLFTKSEQYAQYITSVLNQLTGSKAYYNIKLDKRKESYTGYRVLSTNLKYFDKLREIFYSDRKRLTSYICDRLSEESLAHVWMCDGYLQHQKNRKTNKIQNIGEFCLESFDKSELELFIKKLNYYNINTTLYKVPWGFGYRPIIRGIDLQKFISLIYPYILDDFKYKTLLYYKSLDSIYIDNTLPNAEQYLRTYLNTEDIVRHSW